MQSRFLIRMREGQEVAPRTLDAFSEMVRSGAIRPDDLVFDALTGVWVPAERHPMVQLFKDLIEHDPLSGSADEDHLGSAREFTLTDGRPTLDAAPEPDPLPVVDAERSSGSLVVPAPPLVEEPCADAPRWRRAAWHHAPRGVGAVVAVTAIGVLVTWRSGAEPTAPAEVNAALDGRGLRQASVGPATRVLPASEGEVRARAGEYFATAVDRLREELGLGNAPDVWLEGRYLADARAYPEVERYWNDVRSFVEEIRGRAGALYREAYLQTERELGVEGPLRSLRLASAMEDFAADAPRREMHYQRVSDLAAAALDLHDLMAELEGRVTYEPIRGARLSADPVLEAAGADPEAQSLLEVALDRVLRSLPGSEGLPSRDRSRLTDWIVEGVVR